MNFIQLSCIALSFVLLACNSLKESTPHLVHDIPVDVSNEFVNAVIEIPAGAVEKYEINKTTGAPELEQVDGKPRIIHYLGYPANYGMIPQTYLPKEHGGDGDPLDVLVLGPPVERGTVIPVRIIGMLSLLDRGEQDDKLIAVMPDSEFGPITSIETLHSEFPGVTSIIETWFENYKGPGKMTSEGFVTKADALKILETAKKAYQKEN